MASHMITININGEFEQVEVRSNITLLGMLREELAITGTKNGCHAGECGACTVLLNGEPVNSCMILAVECDGAEIVTVEGLSQDGRLDPLQRTGYVHLGLSYDQVAFLDPGSFILGLPVGDGRQQKLFNPAGSLLGGEF